MAFSIRIKRVYEDPLSSDGYRILIDRLWPRGLTKERACIDEWMKELAPSHELRRWFGHDSKRWNEFQDKYSVELQSDICVELLNSIQLKVQRQNVTLLFAAKGTTENNAVVVMKALDLA